MKKKVLIAGGSGLVGTALSKSLQHKGYEVCCLSRRKIDTGYTVYHWDPNKELIDEEALQDAHAIINLAGAGIADGKWTAARKKILIESRTKSTALLVRACNAMEHPSPIFINASAVGYYGDRQSELLSTASSAGADFMADCCKAWEAATDGLSDKIRLSILRVGVVLTNEGGALPKMKLPVRMGGAGYFGSGMQYMSWIHIDDLVQMLIALIEDQSLSGVFNGVSPNPVTNKELMRSLKKRFAPYALLLPIPAALIKLAMGEQATMLLNSTRLSPDRFLQAGFTFKYPELEQALEAL